MADFDLSPASSPRRAPWRRRFGGALLLASILAPPAAATRLEDAVAAAYARNPTLNAQRFRQKSADEDYVQTRAQYGPAVSLAGTASYDYARLNGTTRDDSTGTASVTVRQPIYSGGRLRGAVTAARATVQAGQELLREVEAETLQNVIMVYAAVLRDEQRVAVGRENLLVLQDQLKENRARRRVQDATVTDLAQSDARLAAAEIQFAALEASLTVSRGDYLQVVGEAPADLQPLPDLDDIPASMDEALAAAADANPLLGEALFRERASSATVASRRGELRPTVSLTARGGLAGTLGGIGQEEYQRQISGSITLSQPLFDSGVTRSRIRQAEAINQADQVGIDGARREALQRVVRAWSQLSAARISLVSGLRQVDSAQIAFAGMQRERQFGLRSTIEVLNAEQELQSAQLQFLQTRYSEYVARAALLAAMGMLRAEAIVPGIPLYDAEAAFRKVRNRGMTPLEPIAMALDRIGSANPRRPASPSLTGVAIPHPGVGVPLPPAPGPALMRGALTPITKSPLVPASALPDGGGPGPALSARPGGGR